MAVNNWRTLIGWYTAPNWVIYQEYSDWTVAPLDTTTTNNNITYTPTTTNTSLGWTASFSSSPFSTSDVLKYKYEWYNNAGDKDMANAFKTLWTWSTAYDKTANLVNDIYNQLWNYVTDKESGLAWAKYELARQLTDDLLGTRKYVMDMFGPEWQLTKEVNNYYWDLSNYIESDSGREIARIAAEWVHSGASLGALRAQRNEAYNQSFERYIKAKEQELAAKQTIASNLINYLSTLRQEYWDTTNAYVISQYQRLNDMLEAMANSIASTNSEIATAKYMPKTTSWGSSSSSSTTSTTNLTDYVDAYGKAQAYALGKWMNWDKMSEWDKNTLILNFMWIGWNAKNWWEETSKEESVKDNVTN